MENGTFSVLTQNPQMANYVPIQLVLWGTWPLGPLDLGMILSTHVFLQANHTHSNSLENDSIYTSPDKETSSVCRCLVLNISSCCIGCSSNSQGSGVVVRKRIASSQGCHPNPSLVPISLVKWKCGGCFDFEEHNAGKDDITGS